MHHILNTGRKYGQIALRLLYPVRCPFCDEIVPGFEKLICDTCREELTPIKDYCMKCGKHVGQGEEYCSSCREISHNFSRGRCLLPYEGKQESLFIAINTETDRNMRKHMRSLWQKK